jgi:CRP/FNR family transcriptional regulator
MLTAVRQNPNAIKSMLNRGFLGTLDLFKSIPAEAMVDLEKRMVEKHFSRHETILLEGDPAESIWIIKEGRVKSSVTAPNGRCQTLCMGGPSAMFGTCCCLGGSDVPCHSVAESDVTVVTLPLSTFKSLMARYPAMMDAFMGRLSNRLRQAKDMQTFEQESVEKRILHLLVGLASEFGNNIPLTRREIAEMVGTTVESSIRTMLHLESKGLVDTARGQITVKNVQNLIDRIEDSEE